MGRAGRSRRISTYAALACADLVRYVLWYVRSGLVAMGAAWCPGCWPALRDASPCPRSWCKDARLRAHVARGIRDIETYLAAGPPADRPSPQAAPPPETGRSRRDRPERP
jgi:hypothetical protein